MHARYFFMGSGEFSIVDVRSLHCEFSTLLYLQELALTPIFTKEVGYGSIILTHFMQLVLYSATRMAVITNVSYLTIQVLLLPRDCHWVVDSVVLAVGVVVYSIVSCALQNVVSDKIHI